MGDTPRPLLWSVSLVPVGLIALLPGLKAALGERRPEEPEAEEPLDEGA